MLQTFSINVIIVLQIVESETIILQKALLILYLMITFIKNRGYGSFDTDFF